MRILSAILLGSVLLASPALAEDPYARPDDTWISISGEVESVSPDTFTLNYGDGLITVEMDDGDRDADAYKLVKGDRVTVNGMIDDDLFETRTIEASSVYVENIGTYFFASAVDEEDVVVTVTTPIVLSRVELQGNVTNVGENQFRIDTGVREITVEIDDLPYNPLDDDGYQKIREGDWVSVTGVMENGFLQERTLHASSVVTVHKASS